MWVRGLKPLLDTIEICVCSVAPHVGAWIETAIGAGANLLGGVAPHVGAGIETLDLALSAGQ